MIDLSGRLSAAANTRWWFSDVLGQLRDDVNRGSNGWRVDWDEAVPEDWALVTNGGDAAAYVWRQGPFAFVQEDACPPDVVAALERLGCDMVSGSLGARKYSLDLKAAQRAFPGVDDWSDFDLNAFSAAELWYQTVTG